MTSGREGSTTSGATTPPHVVLCDPPVTFARAEAPDDPSGAGSSGAPSFFFDEANDWVIAHEEDDDATTASLRCHPLPPRGLARAASGAAGAVPPRPVSIRVPRGPALDARVSPQWKPGLDRRDFRSAPRLVAEPRGGAQRSGAAGCREGTGGNQERDRLAGTILQISVTFNDI